MNSEKMIRDIFAFLVILKVICVAGGVVSANDQLSSLETILSDEIMRDIEAGKDINIDHAKIVGDLDFELLKMNQCNKSKKYLTINSSIRIYNSELDGSIRILNANFSKDILIKNTKFNDRVEFESSKFQKKFTFIKNRLEGEAFFNDDVFNEDVILIKSSFHDLANFEKTKFHKMAYFNSAYFGNYANFQGASFDDYADFKGAEFLMRADFHKAIFTDRVEFNDAIFHEQAFFSKSMFGGNATFTGADFKGIARFWGARFLHKAKFSEVTFEKIAYFNDKLSMNASEFDGDLDLSETHIQSIYLENAKFKKRISLNNSDFNKLVVEWSLIKGPIYYNGQVFQDLIRNFKAQERFLDADKCYFDYRYASMDGWLDYLSLISCGFGVCPHYTLAFSIFLIFFFGIFFGLSNGINRIVPDNNRARLKGQRTKRRNHFKDLGEGFKFSLLVFTFQTRGEWKAKGIYQIFSILEGVFGLLLFALFTVTLANIMIRY